MNRTNECKENERKDNNCLFCFIFFFSVRKKILAFDEIFNPDLTNLKTEFESIYLCVHYNCFASMNGMALVVI